MLPVLPEEVALGEWKTYLNILHPSIEHIHDNTSYMPLAMVEGYACRYCGKLMPANILGIYRALFFKNPPVWNDWDIP